MQHSVEVTFPRYWTLSPTTSNGSSAARRACLIQGFFARRRLSSIPEVEEILIFEPREFISTGDSVTVLGWERTRARPAGKVFETEWVHVFTARDGEITPYWGKYDTEVSAAARA